MGKENDHSKYANWIDPADCIPYERNAKEHTEKQVSNIANSIRRFGWQQDVVITSDNVLVIGHGRRLAAIKLGCQMPYHMIDKQADELTDKDIRELRIADNQTNSETGYDFDLLNEDIDGLDFDGFDFDFMPSFEDSPADVGEDSMPEVQEEAVAQLGQIYQLGDHRLMCGDSTDAETVRALLDGAKVDMVFTDPPYGMDLDTDYSSMVNKLEFAQGKNIKNGRKYEQGKVDEFHPEMITAALSVDAPEVFLWGANYYAEILPNRNDGSWIVWDKRTTENTDEDGGGSANGKAIYFASSVKSSADYASGKNNTMMRAKLTGGKSISYYSAQSMYNSALSRGDKLAKACSQADYKSSANLYALAKGYDIVTSSDYCMVLNRRCLTVSDKTMKNVTYGTKVWH